jgi:hypothetical protein
VQSRSVAELGPDQLPSWRRDPVPLETEQGSHLGFEPNFDPLFDTRWTRAIVGALCAVMTRDGAVDVPALVDRLARCQPVTQLPVRRRPTLRLGIQLLVDEGPGMMPFRRDVRDLALRITQVVGVDRTSRLSFSDHPLRVDEDDDEGDPRNSYRLPASGTPVVVLSDFGLSRGAGQRGAASLSEWLRFAALLRSGGCSAIGLVPLPSGRWPRELSRAIKLVMWDRRTAVGEARRVASRGPAG